MKKDPPNCLFQKPEEWPIMPVTHLGFKMIPAVFFTHNPALDVPK